MEFKTRFISREDRRITRQALTGKHGFKALVEVGSASVNASLTDFSSLGFALIIKQNYSADFMVGESITASVSPLIDHTYLIKGVIIDIQASKNNQVKISAVIDHEQQCKHGDYHPIHLTSEQSMKGHIVHPFMYKQNSYFELESLSRNGFYATNIIADFTLFNEMEVVYSLGSVHGLQLAKGIVSNVSLTGDNKIRCFIETKNLPFQAENELSQHCFHFADKTPRDISRAGLKAKHIQELVQYRFVETQAEYEAVLKLRRKFYFAQGMCAKDDAIAMFAMEQDAYGRILIVFHNERVIGSALLVFGERGIKPFELDAQIPISSFTKLPRYNEIMEITAICIERHYQDTDVLHGVFENMYREGLSAGKKYIMVASSPELLTRYERMGFRPTQSYFQHPKKKDLRMSVMMLNKNTGKTGKGMNPTLWWQVWGHVSLYLYQRRIIEYSLAQKAWVYFNRAMFECTNAFKRIVRAIR